jgi:hypothetical protein
MALLPGLDDGKSMERSAPPQDAVQQTRFGTPWVPDSVSQRFDRLTERAVADRPGVVVQSARLEDGAVGQNAAGVADRAATANLDAGQWSGAVALGR